MEKNKESEEILGYFHSVSPMKTSKTNSRYFNAVVQTARQEYHDAVIFTPEKYNSIVAAERSKTPVKLKNARKAIGFKEDYDIHLTRDTTIDVTSTINFTHRQPQETQISIADVSKLPSHKPILRLIATVSNSDTPSQMVSVRDTQSEVKSYEIGDTTGVIRISLWDKQIEKVQQGHTYIFTNLSTRQFNGKVNLTTTRSTTITQHTTTIPVSTSHTSELTPQTHTITQPIEGTTITIRKVCPKCHTTQHTINIKDTFHRCMTCKILRKQSSYITKCTGTLIFSIDEQELSLAIPNTVLTKFLKNERDISYLDTQNIEEYLLTCGALTVRYTPDNHVIDMTKHTYTTDDTPDNELCRITDQVSLSTNPGKKRHAAPEEHTGPKQTRHSEP